MHISPAEYVAKVCQQIRWKMAHGRVAGELTAHIDDTRDAYIQRGMSRQDATAAAIADTGDATLIGTDLDRIHRPKPQWGMLLAVAAFLAIGVLAHHAIVHSTNFPIWNMESLNRRLVFMAVGIVAMFVAYFLDFTIIGKYAKPLYLITALFSAVSFVFVPWSMQNLAILQGLTLAMPLVYAGFVYSLKGKGFKGVVWAVVAYAVLCFVALLIGVGAALFHFSFVGIAILLAAIAKNWFVYSVEYDRIKSFATALVPFFAAVGFGVMETWHRLQAAINPMIDPMGFGFVGHITRQILSNAVWLGESQLIPIALHQGVEYRHQNIFFLPAPLNNLMLTSIISLFGWLPFIAIMAGLVAFIVYGFVRCFRQKSGLGFFVSFAIMLTFTVQAVAYVVYNLGFPLVLISLPLMSPGNVAMVVNLGLIGIMLSVFRTGDVVEDAHAAGVKIA